jgi:hypothetical protein
MCPLENNSGTHFNLQIEKLDWRVWNMNTPWKGDVVAMTFTEFIILLPHWNHNTWTRVAFHINKWQFITFSAFVILCVNAFMWSDAVAWMSDTNSSYSVALSPRANYTDWTTATCRWNLVPTFVDRGVSRGQRGGSPTVVNLTFLDRTNSSYRSCKCCWTTGILYR